MSIEFRPLAEADLPRMLEIESKAYSDPWTMQLLRESLTATMTHCMALTVNGALQGYAIFQVIFTEGHLLNIAVDPAVQKRGLGRTLLKKVLYHAYELGALSFFLEVRPSNKAALHLYEKEGFRKLMVREKYYSNGEEAVVMLLDLMP